MRDKLLQLVWDLAMTPDAPRELLRLKSLAAVVQQYMNHAGVSVMFLDELGSVRHAGGAIMAMLAQEKA